MKPITLVRIGIPGSIVAAGIVLLFFPNEYANGAGVLLIGSGVLVALANGLLRQSFQETGDRDREQEAREFYGEHGHWPGEPEPTGHAPDLGPARAPTAAKTAAATPEAVEPPHLPAPTHPGVDARPSAAGSRSARSRGRRKRPPRRPD